MSLKKTNWIYVLLLMLSSCSDQNEALESAVNLIELEINRDFWEGCETGEKDCPVLKFTRNSISDSVILHMPSGGTSTHVLLYSAEDKLIQEIKVPYSENPTFNLTKLPDGSYFASMLACGLGGTVSFELTTAQD